MQFIKFGLVSKDTLATFKHIYLIDNYNMNILDLYDISNLCSHETMRVLNLVSTMPVTKPCHQVRPPSLTIHRAALHRTPHNWSRCQIHFLLVWSNLWDSHCVSSSWYLSGFRNNGLPRLQKHFNENHYFFLVLKISLTWVLYLLLQRHPNKWIPICMLSFLGSPQW